MHEILPSAYRLPPTLPSLPLPQRYILDHRLTVAANFQFHVVAPFFLTDQSVQLVEALNRPAIDAKDNVIGANVSGTGCRAFGHIGHTARRFASHAPNSQQAAAAPLDGNTRQFLAQLRGFIGGHAGAIQLHAVQLRQLPQRFSAPCCLRAR